MQVIGNSGACPAQSPRSPLPFSITYPNANILPAALPLPACYSNRVDTESDTINVTEKSYMYVKVDDVA